jgi:signal peptidase I
VTFARRATSSIAGGWLSATLAAVGVALLLPLATFLTCAWLLGWQLVSVQTGSMAPAYAVGSLLVVEDIDPAAVQAGTPLVFQDPRDRARLVTHRVMRVIEGPPPAFITKGDANATEDGIPVGADLVRGRVMWSVTHLGNVLDWLQWPRSLVLIVVPAALLLLQGRGDRARRAEASRQSSPLPVAEAR